MSIIDKFFNALLIIAFIVVISIIILDLAGIIGLPKTTEKNVCVEWLENQSCDIHDLIDGWCWNCPENFKEMTDTSFKDACTKTPKKCVQWIKTDCNKDFESQCRTIQEGGLKWK